MGRSHSTVPIQSRNQFESRQTASNSQKENRTMMDAEERRQFVYDNVVCIWGYNRKNEGPAMTIGYYVMDGDDLCYFTMAKRARAKVARRDPRASVRVLDMQKPPSALVVEGQVRD